MSDENKFTCATCGREHKFSAYVIAHWKDKLIHTCECGQKSQVYKGLVKPLKSKAAPAQEQPK